MAEKNWEEQRNLEKEKGLKDKQTFCSPCSIAKMAQTKQSV